MTALTALTGRAGTLATAVALLLLTAMAAPAAAHTELKEASPASGATVPAPKQVVLTYADSVILPQVVVTDGSGHRHESGSAHAVDNKVTQPVNGTLEPGTYTVGWRVVSTDGHPVTGTYRFTVAGGAQPGPAAPAASPAPATKSQSTGWWWIGLIALTVAALAGGAALLRRRTSTR
jgi:methionine-rich copper-binding protein CopC